MTAMVPLGLFTECLTSTTLVGVANDPTTEALATVVELVTRVGRASQEPDQRLEVIVDLLSERLHSDVGLMVHGAPDGFAVRAVGRAATPDARHRMGEEMRITGAPDPLLDPFRRGAIEPTTAARAHGGQEAWQASAKCIGSIEIWGINQVAARPVRGGVEFVAFLIGRYGEDYDDDDLDLLRSVQPVVAGLAQLLEPEHLIVPSLRGARLTAREEEVLRLLADGHKASSIARRIGCSERTVHRHLSNVYGKLDVGDRLTAVTRAQQLGLLAEVPVFELEPSDDGTR